MIEPNFGLMLWLIFIGWIIKALCKITLGAIGTKKETKWDKGDMVAGFISLIIALIIVFA